MNTDLGAIVDKMVGLPVAEASRRVSELGGFLIVQQPQGGIKQDFRPGRVRVLADDDNVVSRVVSFDPPEGPVSMQT